MTAFVQSLADAQRSVSGIDTRDVSSLAYVSSLVALESMLPTESVAEFDFEVTVLANGAIRVELKEANIAENIREAINVVASHYFQAKLNNIPVSVH